MTNPNVNQTLNEHLYSKIKNASQCVNKIFSEDEKVEEISDIILTETVAKFQNLAKTAEPLCKILIEQSEKDAKYKTSNPMYTPGIDSSVNLSSNDSLQNSASTLSSQCSVIEKITVYRGNVSEILAVTLHESCENISKGENITSKTSNEVVKIGKASSETATQPETLKPKIVQQTESCINKNRHLQSFKLTVKRNNSFTNKPDQASRKAKMSSGKSEICKISPRRKNAKYYITYKGNTLSITKRKMIRPAMIIYKPYLPFKIRILQKLLPQIKGKLYDACVKDYVKDELKIESDKNSLDVKCSTGSSTALRRADDVRSVSTFHCEAKNCIKSTLSFHIKESHSQLFMPIDVNIKKKYKKRESNEDFSQKPTVKKPSRTNKPITISDTARKENQLDSKPAVTKQNQNDNKNMQIKRPTNDPEKERVSARSEIKSANKTQPNTRVNVQPLKLFLSEKKRVPSDNDPHSKSFHDSSSCEHIPIRKPFGNPTKLHKNLEVNNRGPNSDKASPFTKKMPLRKKLQQSTNQEIDTRILNEPSQQLPQLARKIHYPAKPKCERSFAPEKSLPKITLKVDTDNLNFEKRLDLNTRKPAKEQLRKNTELTTKCSPTDRKQPKNLSFDSKLEPSSKAQSPDDTNLNTQAEPDIIRLPTRKFTRATSAPSQTKLHLPETLYASKRTEIRAMGKFPPTYTRSCAKVPAFNKIKRTVRSESESLNYLSNKIIYRNSRSPTNRNSWSISTEQNNKNPRLPTREQRNLRSTTKEQNSKSIHLPNDPKISKTFYSKKILSTKDSKLATESSPESYKRIIIKTQTDSKGDYIENTPQKSKLMPVNENLSNKHQLVNDIYSSSCSPTIMRLSTSNTPLLFLDSKPYSTFEMIERQNKKLTVREFNNMHMTPILEMDNTHHDEMYLQPDTETTADKSEQSENELSQIRQSENQRLEDEPSEIELFENDQFNSEQSENELTETENIENEQTKSEQSYRNLEIPNSGFPKYSQSSKQEMFYFTDQETIIKPVYSDCTKTCQEFVEKPQQIMSRTNYCNNIYALDGTQCERLENIGIETESKQFDLATIHVSNWSAILNFEKRRYLELQPENAKDKFKLPRCTLDSNKSLALKKKEYSQLDPSYSPELLIYQPSHEKISSYATLSFGGTVPTYWNSLSGEKQHSLSFISDFFKVVRNQTHKNEYLFNANSCHQFSKKKYNIKKAEYRKIRHVKMGKYKSRQVKALLEQLIKLIEIKQMKGHNYSKKCMLGKFLLGVHCHAINELDNRNSCCDCLDVFNRGIYCNILLEFVIILGCVTLFILINLIV